MCQSVGPLDRICQVGWLRPFSRQPFVTDRNMTMNSTDAENSTDHDPRHRHVIELRVAYQETDGQRRVHHANYLNYFERGRVEMLRAQGISYRQLEDTGV